MAEEHVQRRLAAIVVADVVGYSRMMERDEVATLAVLKERRATILQPIVRAHGGRIVKVMGDGVLLEFASAVNALSGAIELQRKMADANAALPEARRIVLRIGINLGDVVIDGSDLYGDGVNIAARLQSLAEPGAIYVSAGIRDHVNRKLAFGFDDLGPKSLKNIAEPVHVYRVVYEPAATMGREGQAALPLPDKPSIAVLPFANMSGDPEREYFADGVTEDIITALSRVRSFFVIARNSTFTYKGRAVDVRQVGRELGVRYVLEGSVRKAGDQLRITGQLIEAETGHHIWAEKYDGALTDVFDLQDEVVRNIVSIVEPSVTENEIQKVFHRPAIDSTPYDHYLRGLATYHDYCREGWENSLRHFTAATELDLRYANAWAGIADCLGYLVRAGWRDVEAGSRDAKTAALKGIEADPGNGPVAATAGWILAIMTGEVQRAVRLVEAALVLHPNSAEVRYKAGWCYIYNREPEKAITHFQHHCRLNPLDKQIYVGTTGLAAAHFDLGQYEAAADLALVSWQINRNAVGGRYLAASLSMLGRHTEAATAMQAVLSVYPNLTLSRVRRLSRYVGGSEPETFIEGLRRAGLPE